MNKLDRRCVNIMEQLRSMNSGKGLQVRYANAIKTIELMSKSITPEQACVVCAGLGVASANDNTFTSSFPKRAINTLDYNELTGAQYVALFGRNGIDPEFLDALALFNSIHEDLPEVVASPRMSAGRVIGHVVRGSSLPPHAVEWLLMRGVLDAAEGVA